MLEVLGDCIESYTSGEMWKAFLDAWGGIQVAIVLILLGFATAAVWWVVRQVTMRRALRTWHSTRGEVISFDRHVSLTGSRPLRRSYSYTARYDYTDFRGRPQQGETKLYDEPHPGQQLTVHVDKLEPTDSMVIKKGDLTALSMLIEVFTWLIVLTIALFGFWLFLTW